jgi:hypothetical protein
LTQDSVAAIAYHSSSSDPFYTTEADARDAYYAITGTPTVFFDGVTDVVGGDHTQSMYAYYRPPFNQRKVIPSSLDVTLTGYYDPPSHTGLVNAFFRNTGAGTVSGTLQFALTETDIPYAWQGQDSLYHLMRDMLPDANGEAFTLAAGDTVSVSRTYTLDPSWVPGNCEIVLFVQGSGREIMQGAKSRILDLAYLGYAGHSVLDSVVGNSDGQLDPGETADLVISVQNIRNTTMNDVQGYLRTDSPYVTLLDSTCDYGNIAPGGSSAGDPYRFALSEAVPGGYQIPFLLHVSGDGGAYEVDLEVIVQVDRYDYRDHDFGNVRLTVTDRGAVGLLYPGGPGSGLRYPVTNARSLLYQGSIVVGTDASYVAGGYGSSADWEVTSSPDGKLKFHSFGDSLQTSWSSYSDGGHPAPKGILVTQLGEARSEKKYVVLKFLLENAGATPVTGLYAGFLCDFDIYVDLGSGYNRASVDASRDLAFVYWSGYNPYAGLCLVSPQTPRNTTVIDNSIYAPNKEFPDSSMIRFLDGALSFSTGAAQKDWSVLVSTGPYDLEPGETDSVSFAIVAGDNLADLQASADLARTGIADSGPGEIRSPQPQPRLQQNSPNPFSSATTIRYEVPTRGQHVSLRIYNIQGELVRTLAEGASEAGTHSCAWDGRNAAGRSVSNGLYFARLAAGGVSRTIRLHRIQ